MTPTKFVPLAALLAALSIDVRAESAGDILDSAWAAQVSRWQGLDAYLVEQTVMGNKTKQYFLRTVITEEDGTERVTFLPSPDPVLESGCVEMSSVSEAMQSGADGGGDLFRWFTKSAEVVGEEAVGGTATWQLRASGVDSLQSMNGESVTMDVMSLWLSKDDYLPIKMRFEGEATVNGQVQPVAIETLNSDFRTVPGTQLTEPFRRVMSISGMTAGLDDDKIAEAQAQLEKMEAQMASMPAAQRKMMEKMMGPQLETMRSLAESGSIETEILVNSITPNPEIDGAKAVACDVS